MVVLWWKLSESTIVRRPVCQGAIVSLMPPWMRRKQECDESRAPSTALLRGTRRVKSSWHRTSRGAVSRVHVEWRRSLYNLAYVPEGVEMSDLQKVRITQKEFADGTADVEQDEWGETPRQSNACVTRKTKGAWRGMTWFFLEGANPAPGPARRRIVGKRPPVRDRGVGVVEELEDRS